MLRTARRSETAACSASAIELPSVAGPAEAPDQYRNSVTQTDPQVQCGSEVIIHFRSVGARLSENTLIEADEAEIEDVQEIFFARKVAHEARDFPLIVVEGVADPRVFQPVGTLSQERAVYQVEKLMTLEVGAELQIERSVPHRSL